MNSNCRPGSQWLRALASGLALVAFLPIAPGCAGSAVGGGGAAGTANGGTGAGDSGGGSGGQSGSGGSANGPCPAAVPANGAPCTMPYTSTGIGSAQCSYGDDPRPQCRTTASCSAGMWHVSDPSCPAQPLPAACPMPHATAGSTCSDSTLSCWYDDGTRCWCSACKGGAEYPICQPIDPPQWQCAAPARGCPTTAPQAGSPCSTPGASCGPDCTQPITCTAGVWQWGGIMCPICAAPDTPIATPNGERAIASLHVGDLVYSVDHDAVVAVPLSQVGHTAVANHRIVRVVLENGRVLEISAGHPTADGRTFGDLLAGGQLDAQNGIASAELAPYRYDATYDILPASSTGSYFAAGALIGSTLFGR